MKYLVVIEHGPTSFGDYVPDLPGCVAVGETQTEVTTLIHEAIEFHIEGLAAGYGTAPSAQRVSHSSSQGQRPWAMDHLSHRGLKARP